MNVGDKIKLARASKGLSLNKLSQQIGVSKVAISKWETGKVVPSSDRLLQLSKSLDKPVPFFLRQEQNVVSLTFVKEVCGNNGYLEDFWFGE